MNDVLCAKFIDPVDDREFYVEADFYPAPMGKSGNMIRPGMYFVFNEEAMIYDGSFWLRRNDPRIVGKLKDDYGF